MLLKLVHVFEPPVCIEELALEVGLVDAIDVDPASKTPARSIPSGPGGDSWRILLRQQGRLVNRRVLIAHEAKHIIDHGLDDRLYPPAEVMSSEQRQEYVANYFALCLLMPREWLERRWKQDSRDVEALARAFGVPVRSMGFRLRTLDLL